MTRKDVLHCLVAGVLQLLACVIVYLFKVPNPNIVFFVILSASLVQYGYGAGIATGAVALVYSAFFFSTDHSLIAYTPLNLHKMLVIVLGVAANIYIIGRLQKSRQQAMEEVARLEIQEKKAAEMEALAATAESASRAKSRFLANMSHDIRTPLNGMVGLIRICQEHLEDTKLLQENFAKMNVAADHLVSLVNDVLQMSRIEAGAENIAPEPVCLGDIVQDIATIAGEGAKSRGLCWQWQDDGDLSQVHVLAVPLHLRRIFLNIYGNSIKFTTAGGEIATNLRRVSESGNRVVYRWTISDTGRGMSQEFLEHIFEPFAQEKSGARSHFEGTGLGMPIVKHLIDNMGGTIEVASQIGRGTVIAVELPFEMAESVATRPSSSEQTQGIQGIRILLAEDNDLNAQIARVLLTDKGAQVTLAGDGQQAVDIFAGEPEGTFDVVLMDIMMPVMDGYEATAAIRNLPRADAQSVPIVAVTANAFVEDRQKAIDAGMNDHVAKPIDMEQLLSVIKKQLRKRNIANLS